MIFTSQIAAQFGFYWDLGHPDPDPDAILIAVAIARRLITSYLRLRQSNPAVTHRGGGGYVVELHI